ncbi:MAG: hypothetical protein HDT42_03940 [Ruminococcaceae bacterium]|nr:hypothetical protein [Oscillospiraceae bacterium]
MVKFIAERANRDIGAGVRKELISLLESGKSHHGIVYIVPEQFEYETEHAVYRILESKGLLARLEDIKITTFSRLSDEILRLSGDMRPLADDIVKNVIMHKTLSEWSGELSALAGISARQGFSEKMVQTISTLKTAGISARDLELSIAESDNEKIPENSPLAKKLKDTCMLYTEYEVKLADYIDKPDVITLAADYIARHTDNPLSGADIFVDCFNDFTSGQMRFLCELIEKSANITFGFVADYDSEREVFATAKSNINLLNKKATDEGIPVEFSHSATEKTADDSPLCELARNLFQGGKSDIPAADSVEVINAANVYSELDFVCAKIKQLTAQKGLRYREIAVLCPNIGAYAKYVEAAFKKYEIPMFCDMGESILYQPLVNAVISLLNTLRSFSLDSVMSCVKTGFYSKFDEEKGERVGLSTAEINTFESYVYEWSLGTNHLKKPFTFKNPHCVKTNKPDYDAEAAEKIRADVVEPILKLQKKIRTKKDGITGAEFTELLYRFIADEMGIGRVMLSKTLDRDGNPAPERVALFQRLWDTLVGIFNTLHSELADEKVTAEEYYSVFRDICAGTALASPPQYVDCVLVGDIDRTRADNIRAAFIVGASYEAFPTPAPQSGIFSEHETEILRESLAQSDNNSRNFGLKSAREQYQLALYRAYRAITLPTEYLCVSYPENAANGEKQRRSDVIVEILRIFPELKSAHASDFGAEFYCSSLGAAKQRFAFGLNSANRETELVRRALNINGFEDFTEQLESIKSERANELDASAHKISEHLASRLFSKVMGATAVEDLEKCKFMYFCKYGLGISERDQRAFTFIRRGDAIHFVLEHVLGEFSGNIDSLFALSRGELYRLSAKYLEQYCREETNNEFEEDMRTGFLFRNIANSATDVLITVQAEFYARKYRPQFFELDIKETGEKHFAEEDFSQAAPPPPAELYSESETAEVESAATERKDSDRYILTKPLEIKLHDNLSVFVRGRIDRVDALSACDENGCETVYLRTVDYKSSAKSFDLNLALHGINIQMLLYLFALIDANRDNPTKIRAGGVCYVPSKSSGAVDSEMSPYTLLALNHREDGLIVHSKPVDDDWEAFKEFTLNKIKAESGEEAPESIMKAFEYAPESEIDEEKFEQLREDIISVIRDNFSEVFGGDIGAIPTVYSESRVKLNGKKETGEKNPCNYCIYKSVCKNRGENVNKIEKPKDIQNNPYMNKEDGENG